MPEKKNTQTVEEEAGIPTENEEAASQAEAVADNPEEKNPAEELQKKITELEAKLAKQEDIFKRTVAEYDNYRKRTAREMGSIAKEEKANAVKELLPIADNIERALTFGDSSAESLFKGVEMIAAQFKNAFDKLGVEAIGDANVPFDPEIHNAVMHIEDEEQEQNVVVEVFQKGYRLGDKVVRPAMVKVAN